MDMQLCFRKSSSIVSRSIAGETILVPIRQNTGDLESIYTLNETAALAWGLLDGQHTLAEIQAAIEASYLVDGGQAQSDILELVRSMLLVGAIEQV